MTDLEHREEIRDVLARYCRAVDRNDRELLLTVYHPDAIDDHGAFIGSPAEFADHSAKAALELYESTTHVLGSSLIELDGDEAAVETYFTGMHVLKPSEHEARRLMTSVGRYVDRFERRDGEWRISRRVVVKSFRNVKPLDEPAGDQFVLARRDRLDPSYTGAHATSDLDRG